MSAEFIQPSDEERENARELGQQVWEKIEMSPFAKGLTNEQLIRLCQRWKTIIERRGEPFQLYKKYPLDEIGGKPTDYSPETSESYQVLLHSNNIVNAYPDNTETETGGWHEEFDPNTTENIQRLQSGYLYKKTETSFIGTDPDTYHEAKQKAKSTGLPLEQILFDNSRGNEENL